MKDGHRIGMDDAYCSKSDGSSFGNCFCGPRSGEVVWSFALESSSSSSPTLSANGSTLFVGSVTGSLRAVNATSGANIWSFETPAGMGLSSPTIGPVTSSVFVGSKDRSLYAVDAHTGALQWQYGPTTSAFQASAAVSPDGSIVFVGSLGGTLSALSSLRGEVVWKFQTHGQIFSTPAVAEDGTTVFIGSYDHHVYAVDVASGEERWRYDAGNPIVSSPVLSVDGSMLFVGAGLSFSTAGGRLDAIDAQGGHQVWTYTHKEGPNPASFCSPPALSADGASLFAVASDGTLYAVATLNGTLKWKLLPRAVGSGVTLTPALSTAADGAPSTIYVGGGDGSVRAIDASTGTELWHYAPVNHEITSSPVLSTDGSTFYVASDDKMLRAVSA